MLATKVWEDEPVWNTDFINLFPSLTSDDLGLLERNLLRLLSFNATLTASQYAEVYFDLRAGSKSIEEHFKNLQPLDQEGARRLEERSAAFSTTAAKTAAAKGTAKDRLIKSRAMFQSDSHLKTVSKSPKVILN